MLSQANVLFISSLDALSELHYDLSLYAIFDTNFYIFTFHPFTMNLLLLVVCAKNACPFSVSKTRKGLGKYSKEYSHG